MSTRSLHLDIWRGSLTLSLMIEKGGVVEVYDRPRLEGRYTKEEFIVAFRNFLALFDRQNRNLHVHIYDGTFGTPEGTEAKRYLKNKLTEMASSCLCHLEVVPHLRGSFD